LKLENKTVDLDNIKFDYSLKDGGHKMIKCSACQAPLNDIWITRPDKKYEWKIVSECPHCDDTSFVVVVQGQFHLGSGYIENPLNPEDREKDIIYTEHIDVVYNDEIATIKNRKVKKWG